MWLHGGLASILFHLIYPFSYRGGHCVHLPRAFTAVVAARQRPSSCGAQLTDQQTSACGSVVCCVCVHVYACVHVCMQGFIEKKGRGREMFISNLLKGPINYFCAKDCVCHKLSRSNGMVRTSVLSR